MQKLFLLLLPGLLFSENFTTLLQKADNNLLLKAKEQEVIAKESLQKAAQANNYPTLSAKLTAIYLKDTPTMNFNLPFPGLPPKMQVGKKENYTGEVALIYPLFSGFAISNLIEKAKLETAKAKLEKEDAKRRLYMQISSLYANLYALKHTIAANQSALEATKKSLKKAKGFFKAGLLAPSELENIKAKKFEIEAGMQTLKSQQKALQKTLSYLTDSTVTAIEDLPTLALPSSQTLLADALEKREDIRALQKLLEIDEKDIQLAKSNRYPSLTLIGALKSQGDSLRLNGDGYTNPNKSYIGAAVEYKLFDGFSTKHQVEAAKAKKLGRVLYFKDYQKRIKTTLQNEINTLQALKVQKEAKQAQLKAQESYYKLTRGRFENHLVSADELSRAIAAYAVSKAEDKAIEAKIFKQKCKLLLESSLELFKKQILY